MCRSAKRTRHLFTCVQVVMFIDQNILIFCSNRDWWIPILSILPLSSVLEGTLNPFVKKLVHPHYLFWWWVASKSLKWSRISVICSLSLFVFCLFVLYLIQLHMYAALLKWLFLLFTSQNCFCPKKLKTRAYHVSEVCTEGASGLMILHHTVVVEDFSTTFTNRTEESSWPGLTFKLLIMMTKPPSNYLFHNNK